MPVEAADAVETLVERALEGDRGAVARLISLVESGGPDAIDAVARLYPHTGAAYTVGITGAPGSGKSTLTDRLIGAIRRGGERGRGAGHRPHEPVHRRRDPRRPRADARARDRPRRLHSLDGDARAPRWPRARDAAGDPHPRRGGHTVGARRDGRRRPGGGRDRGRGRHDRRGREPGMGRLGPGEQGGPSRDRGRVRDQQGRPSGCRGDGA